MSLEFLIEKRVACGIPAMHDALITQHPRLSLTRCIYNELQNRDKQPHGSSMIGQRSVFAIVVSSKNPYPLHKVPERANFHHVEYNDRDPEFYNLPEAVMLRGTRAILPPKKHLERKCIDKKDCRKFCT